MLRLCRRTDLRHYDHGSAFGRTAGCDVFAAARAQQGIYAGTTSLFFTIGNTTKALPWLLLVKPTGTVWTLMAICLLAIPTGVWLGWRLYGRLDQRQLYRACYMDCWSSRRSNYCGTVSPAISGKFGLRTSALGGGLNRSTQRFIVGHSVLLGPSIETLDGTGTAHRRK